jgi:hypothetical protein
MLPAPQNDRVLTARDEKSRSRVALKFIVPRGNEGKFVQVQGLSEPKTKNPALSNGGRDLWDACPRHALRLNQQ